MNTTPVTAAGIDTLVDPRRLDREAFDRTASARGAMKPEDAPRYTLDAFYAAGTALRTLLRVVRYREDLLTLPKYDIRHLDHFGDNARGLRFVHAQILRRTNDAKQLPALAAEGWRLRHLMLSYADALSLKGLIKPELLARVREGTGYRDLAKDLMVLVLEFEVLPASKTDEDAAVTGADLSRASEVAHLINVFVGADEQDVDASEETLEGERRKLSGLLLEAHSEIRRGVSFFRWKEGDVNTLVPSLYVPPGARKTDPATEVPTTEVPADLAAIHAQLHAAQTAEMAPTTDPEDHPFTSE